MDQRALSDLDCHTALSGLQSLWTSKAGRTDSLARERRRPRRQSSRSRKSRGRERGACCKYLPLLSRAAGRTTHASALAPGYDADPMRVTLEAGPKAKMTVAVAPDWPGLERGAKTEEAAIQRLVSYFPRYAPIATLAGMDAQFADNPPVNVVERYPGTGSTDFWGISFGFSSIDKQDLSSEELKRELALMRACWAFFDAVRARVSPEMQPGPRGGGRPRDRIVGHVVHSEQHWAKKLGFVHASWSVGDEAGLKAHRETYCASIQAFHAEGKMARTWPLRYLIRHTAYHTLDHAWEMEDKDLKPKSA